MNFVNNKFVFDWGGDPPPAPKPSAKVGQKIHREIQRDFLGRGRANPPPKKKKNEFLITRIWFQSKVN